MQPVVAQINALFQQYQSLSNDQLRELSFQLKKNIQEAKTPFNNRIEELEKKKQI